MRVLLPIAALALTACATTAPVALDPLPASVPVVAGADMPMTYQAEDWLRNHYTQRIQAFAAYTPAPGGVVFLGDSITEGGNWAALFPGVETRNYGIGGDQAEGLLSRYQQVVASRPGRILILIGTNDLGAGDTPQSISREVDQLLRRLHADLPQTELVVQSVLPRQPEFATRIRDLNGRLERVADANDAAFIDIFTPFVVAGDRLDPAVTEDDLHLIPAGYDRWAGVIRPCVTEGRC